jgi:hypothetical protein
MVALYVAAVLLTATSCVAFSPGPLTMAPTRELAPSRGSVRLRAAELSDRRAAADQAQAEAEADGEWPELGSDVTVRLVNAAGTSGEDVVFTAAANSILMGACDKQGVRIPRGCQTGICGTCTADLRDPSWDGDEDGRDGWQPVRTCSTRVRLLPGEKEFVVDLFRTSSKAEGADGEKPPDPMARFGQDWENDFVPDYKTAAA